MADQIMAVPGYNNVALLSAFPFSPDTNGVLYPRILVPESQFPFPDGWAFADLDFPDIVTPDDWVASMGKLGLSQSIVGAYVTVRLPDYDKNIFRNYNAIAQRDVETKFDYYWYESPHVRLRRLVLIG